MLTKLMGIVSFSAALLVHLTSYSADSTTDPGALAMRARLQQLYPNTKFTQIVPTSINGVWEVFMGANVAYVNDDGRYFIFGHLYDMKTQNDLTAQKKMFLEDQEKRQKQQFKFADLPLADAIKTVHGKGERYMAVFSDPHCPYCRDLEHVLAQLDNVTIYTFLLPIDAIHPESTSVAESIWCSTDRAMTWKLYMTGKNLVVPSARCESPIARNLELASKARIQGTPFMFFPNGQTVAGAVDLESLQRHIVGK